MRPYNHHFLLPSSHFSLFLDHASVFLYVFEGRLERKPIPKTGFSAALLSGKSGLSRMKKAILFLIFFLLAVDLYWAQGRGLEVEKRAGNYDVLIRLDKHPPIQGDNPVEIEIKDRQGKPITDAKVLVNYYMPPMPRMAPMNYKTDAPFSKGKYRMSINIIMSGPWVIRVLITRESKTSVIKLNVDAQ